MKERAAMPPHPPRFARYLLAVYWLLIVYGSLYPFSGWRYQGVGPLEFLGEMLPHWYTGFDVAANVAAYFPLGVLAVMALAPPLRLLAACALTALAALLTSVSLEALQNYLPNRIPSNLDVAANVTGAVAGALVGYLGSQSLINRRGSIRERWFLPGAGVDVGLVVVALWLFTQLNPATLLFGNGDLRDLFETVPAQLYTAELFMRIEASVALVNIVALAALLGLLANGASPIRRLVLGALAAGLALRALAFATLFRPHEAFAWLTPGAALGLGVGVIAALFVVALPRAWAIAVCGVALMAATALVNLTPGNPYHALSLAAWPQGHFLNFNGLTRLVSTLWPFGALGYLLGVAAGASTRGAVS